MKPTKPMTSKQERLYILNLLDKFITSINSKEEVLIHLGHYTDTEHGTKMYNKNKVKLEDLYYIKSLLDNRVKELNKVKGEK
jgi:hypothetical protein